jgi:two-component system CheB/CheR fusion protein
MNRIMLSDPEFAAVASLLHDAAGLSFDDSRRDSLGFSIAERMHVTQTDDVASYLALLAGPNGGHERQALLDEVTIPETHFFRNPPQIRALRKYVLPELLRQAADGKKLRVWSAGCSTGEEAYTIAMLWCEAHNATAHPHPLQIFASDVDADALAVARSGRYPARFFVRAGAHFRVSADLRRPIVFAAQNVLCDPPYAHLDLISCRNLLIYLQPAAQQAVLHAFHFALLPGGYLFLGTAEDIGAARDLFEGCLEEMADLPPDRFAARRRAGRPSSDDRTGPDPMERTGGREPRTVDPRGAAGRDPRGARIRQGRARRRVCGAALGTTRVIAPAGAPACVTSQ